MSQSPISTGSNVSSVEIVPEEAGFPFVDTPLPVEKREWARVTNEPTVNIHVGKCPNHTLVASNYPALLLALFAPALSAALRAIQRSQTHAVMLNALTPDAVAWFLRFARSNSSRFDPDTLESWTFDELFARLHVILVFGHRSLAALQIIFAAKSALLSGIMPPGVSTWLFGPFPTSGNGPPPRQPRAVRKFALSIADPVVDAVLSGTLCRPLEGGGDAPWWRAAVRRSLAVRNAALLRRQFEHCLPLTHFQMCFIYQFSYGNDRVRETVAHGLLWGIRHGLVDSIDHVCTRHKFPEITERMKRLEGWWRTNGWLETELRGLPDTVASNEDLDPVFRWFQSRIDRFEADDEAYTEAWMGGEWDSEGEYAAPATENRRLKRRQRGKKYMPRRGDAVETEAERQSLEGEYPEIAVTGEEPDTLDSILANLPSPRFKGDRRTQSLPL